MSEENVYTQARRQKIKEYEAAGIQAYPQNIKPTHLASEIVNAFDAKPPEDLEQSA